MSYSKTCDNKDEALIVGKESKKLANVVKKKNNNNFTCLVEVLKHKKPNKYIFEPYFLLQAVQKSCFTS